MYYWRIDSRNAVGITRGPVWSFTTGGQRTQPPQATTNPDPADGASGVSVTTDLRWSSGGRTTTYDVYLGTDATPDADEHQATVGATMFDPGRLSAGTQYYWRVDANNAAGTTAGPVWSFTTAGAPDTQPSFGPGTVANQNYPQNTAIVPLTLPLATGGNPPLTYQLTPAVPGLTFNPSLRQLTGTPTGSGAYDMTYTVTDADGDAASIYFTITVGYFVIEVAYAYTLAWNGSRYIAAGWDFDRAVIKYSDDAMNWSDANVPSSDRRGLITDVAWGAGRFVAIGQGLDGRILHSSDGVNWFWAGFLVDELGRPVGLGAIAWVGGRFVGSELDGYHVIHSSDGMSWTQDRLQNSNGQALSRWGSPQSIASDGSNHVMVGVGDVTVHSTDWLTWQKVPLEPAPPRGYRYVLSKVIATQAGFLAVGTLKSVGGDPVIFRSSDGRNWSAVEVISQLGGGSYYNVADNRLEWQHFHCSLAGSRGHRDHLQQRWDELGIRRQN